MRKVAFIYNSVPSADRTGVYGECATQKTVLAIEEALVQGGNDILSVNLHSPGQLAEIFTALGTPDYAFVIAEGFLDLPTTLYDGSGAALVRETLADFGVPTSHSPAAAMELCRHKEQTYRVLQECAVSIPWYTCLSSVNPADAYAVEPCRFPLFIKPAGGGNSMGIDAGSVVHTPQELVQRIEFLGEELGSVQLVAESFLPGLEYTIGVIGNLNPVVLPPLTFPQNVIRSTEVKKMESRQEVPVNLLEPAGPLYHRLRELALRTYAALGCADVIRVDIKADAAGNLYVIDVNGTPSLGPVSSLTRMSAALDLDYADFINLLLFYGLQRNGLAGPMHAEVAAAEEKISILRLLRPGVA